MITHRIVRMVQHDSSPAVEFSCLYETTNESVAVRAEKIMLTALRAADIRRIAKGLAPVFYPELAAAEPEPEPAGEPAEPEPAPAEPEPAPDVSSSAALGGPRREIIATRRVPDPNNAAVNAARTELKA